MIARNTDSCPARPGNLQEQAPRLPLDVNTLVAHQSRLAGRAYISNSERALLRTALDEVGIRVLQAADSRAAAAFCRAYLCAALGHKPDMMLPSQRNGAIMLTDDEQLALRAPLDAVAAAVRQSANPEQHAAFCCEYLLATIRYKAELLLPSMQARTILLPPSDID